MANVDNPHGLCPLMRTLDGGEPVVRQFSKDAAQATAIFIHDVVNRATDANIDPGGTPGTTLYTGVALNGGAALTLTKHLVIISPSAVFEAQDNNATDGLVEADMGLNANLELNAGSATTGISGHEINETGINTTATLDVHLLKKLEVPENAYGANVRVEVVFNKHRMAHGVAGV